MTTRKDFPNTHISVIFDQTERVIIISFLVLDDVAFTVPGKESSRILVVKESKNIILILPKRISFIGFDVLDYKSFLTFPNYSYDGLTIG